MSVTIQTFPTVSTTKLSGLANPDPPSAGSPPVVNISQRKLNAAGSSLSSRSLITKPYSCAVISPGPLKIRKSDPPSIEGEPDVKEMYKEPSGARSVSSGRAVQVAPAALAA